MDTPQSGAPWPYAGSFSSLGLVMDGVVAALLIAMIWFAWRLDGRLAVLRKDRDGLERLIGGLYAASRQAEESVASLRQSAGQQGAALQALVDRASTLAGDLQLLLEKGEAAADRLEAGLKLERRSQPANPIPAPPNRAPTERAAAPNARLQASQAVRVDPAGPRTSERLPEFGAARSADARASDAAPRPASRPPLDPKPPQEISPALQSPGDERAAPLRSRTERELQKALDARRQS